MQMLYFKLLINALEIHIIRIIVCIHYNLFIETMNYPLDII